MIKKVAYILTLIFSCFLISCVNLNQETEAIKKVVVDSEENIESTKSQEISLESVIKTLTSDEFEGRLVGSNGNKLAENFIDNIFSEIKLEKIFDAKDYKHAYVQEVSDTYGLQDSNSKIEEKEVNNIVGKISGENSKNVLIISAHFDHIGKQNDKIIRGAVDNASGATVLIDLAQNLKKKYNKTKPKFDIIFCAFNGEEKGLEGSSNFVKDIKDKYKKLVNINIDCVGYNNGGDIIFLDKDSESNNIVQKNLYENIEKSLNANNLKVSQNELKGVSDSRSFDFENIPNICLIEENVKEVINTTKDTIEVIDFDKLNSVSNSIYYFITNFSIF